MAIVAILIVPNISGRHQLIVSLAASAEKLKEENPTLFDQWSGNSITLDDNQIRSLPKLDSLISSAKQNANDLYGSSSASATLNGFEYTLWNSRFGGKLDHTGVVLLYNNDFYIVLARNG